MEANGVRLVARPILAAVAFAVALGAAPAAGQAPAATLDVAPVAVTAGDDVTVTGSCPGGGPGTIQGIGPDERAPGDEFEAAFAFDVTVADTTAFTATVTIPDETVGGSWRIGLICQGPGPPERLVTVTPTVPTPLTLTAVPDRVRPGQSITLTASGCLATGRSLPIGEAALRGIAGTTPVTIVGSATPASDGSFVVTLAVPTDFPVARSLLTLGCTDPPGAAVSYSRSYGEGIDVEAPPGTTTTTTPSTTTTARPIQLPRTGATTSLPLLVAVAVLLVAAGATLTTSARRRP